MREPKPRIGVATGAGWHQYRGDCATGIGGAAGWLPQLDTLKAVLITRIIGGHALLGYSAVGSTSRSAR